MDNRSFNNWLEWLMMREVGFDPFEKRLPDSAESSNQTRENQRESI
jgi:hypothetical protein